MGQQISTTNDNNNYIQTPIEEFLQQILEKNQCVERNSISNLINLNIKKLLRKVTHENLEILYKSIYPEKQITLINLDEIISYYNDKIYIIVRIYNLRNKLMDELKDIRYYDNSDVKKMNNITDKINQIDYYSKLLVEEIIHSSTTKDGKTRKVKYYRERPISQKQLTDIMNNKVFK